MAKEFKSTNELIEILNSKGVSIKDEKGESIMRDKEPRIIGVICLFVII